MHVVEKKVIPCYRGSVSSRVASRREPRGDAQDTTRQSESARMVYQQNPTACGDRCPLGAETTPTHQALAFYMERIMETSYTCTSIVPPFKLATVRSIPPRMRNDVYIGFIMGFTQLALWKLVEASPACGRGIR